MKLSKDLRQRYDNALANSMQWRTFLDEAFSYIMPNRNLYDQFNTEVNTPGEKKNREVFDNTAVLAARSFVSKIHITLTPPFKKWADLVAGSQVPQARQDELNQDLYIANEILFSQINRSNADLSLSEAYADFVFGTGALKIDEGTDDDPLQFTAIPISNISVEEDSKGRIRTVWRRYQPLKLRDIMANWPKATIPQNISSASTNNTEAKHEVFEGTVFDEIENKYNYIVVLENGNEILFQDELESSPWIVFRWARLAGDLFGRGVAHDVLPTVKTLNKSVEFMIRGSELSIAPPFLGFSDDVFNPANLNLEPGTIISISRQSAANPPLIPLQITPNLQYSEMMIQSYQRDIRAAFLTNPLMQPEHTPQQTATEVSIRQQNFVEEVGPSFGRFEVELLTPLINRCVFILRKKGLFPNIELNGKEVTVKYESPLIESQKQEELQAFTLAYQNLAGVFTPQMAIATINIEKVVPWIAEKSGADPNLFKTGTEIQGLAEKVQQIVGGQLQQAQPQPEQLPGAIPGGPTAPSSNQSQPPPGASPQ